MLFLWTKIRIKIMCVPWNRPWGPLSPLYNRVRFPLQLVKRPAPCVDHPTTPNFEAEERVELYVNLPPPLRGLRALFWVNFTFTFNREN